MKGLSAKELLTEKGKKNIRKMGDVSKPITEGETEMVNQNTENGSIFTANRERQVKSGSHHFILMIMAVTRKLLPCIP